MSEKCYPVIKVNNEYWIRITHDSITLRAVSISKPQKVPDPSNHRVIQVNAQGSIKLKSKEFWIEKFDSEKARK